MCTEKQTLLWPGKVSHEISHKLRHDVKRILFPVIELFLPVFSIPLFSALLSENSFVQPKETFH